MKNWYIEIKDEILHNNIIDFGENEKFSQVPTIYQAS